MGAKPGQKLKRRGRKVYYQSRPCLSCDSTFKARGHRVQGYFRAIDRLCKKCKKLMAHDFAEDDHSIGDGRVL